jgi:hypothetical protein
VIAIGVASGAAISIAFVFAEFRFDLRDRWQAALELFR